MATTTNIKEHLNSMGHFENFSEVRANDLTKFNRARIALPVEGFGKASAYVFFTKPSLNIISADGSLSTYAANIPFYSDLSRREGGLLTELCYDASGDPFIHLLSNHVRSMDIPDVVLKTQEKGETFLGWRITYGKHGIESKTGYNFSLNFSDNKNLMVYNMIKAWVDYIEHANRGTIEPTMYNITNNILDYAGSIYYFVVGPDSNIKYYAKITGVFPTNIPDSVFSTSDLRKIDMPKYSVSFASTFVRAMDPVILGEFNKLTGAITPVWNYSQDTLTMPDPWVKTPKVYYNRTARCYNLKFGR